MSNVISRGGEGAPVHAPRLRGPEEQLPRELGPGDLEEVDAVNSNSIVLYERYSHRRRSVGASSTSSDDSDACRIVVPVSDGEMEADDRYLQNLGRKVSMIAAEASQAQVCILA